MGDDTKDYMLSQVLASHGCAIRDLSKEYIKGKLYFNIRWIRFENGEKVESELYIYIPSEFDMEEPENHFGPAKWDDLHIRYVIKDEKLLRPTWVDAFCYGNGMPNHPIGIMRSENSKMFLIA